MEFCPVPLNVLAAYTRSVCIFRCFMYICINNFTFEPWVPTAILIPHAPSAFVVCLLLKYQGCLCPLLMSILSSPSLRSSIHCNSLPRLRSSVHQTQRHNWLLQLLNAPQVPKSQQSQNQIHIFPLLHCLHVSTRGGT